MICWLVGWFGGFSFKLDEALQWVLCGKPWACGVSAGSEEPPAQPTSSPASGSAESTKCQGFPFSRLATQAGPMHDWCCWRVAPPWLQPSAFLVTLPSVSLSLPSLMKPPPSGEASSSMLVVTGAVRPQLCVWGTVSRSLCSP